MPDPDDLARLEAILAASPRARSPLFRWLTDHFDEVARLVRRYGRNWTAMAQGLNELGVTRRGGAPVSPDSLRKTWREVCRAETLRRKDESAAARRPGTAAPPEPSPEAHFEPARLRSGYRAAAIPGDGPPPASGPGPARTAPRDPKPSQS